MNKFEYHEILINVSELHDDWVVKYIVDEDVIVWREELDQVKKLTPEEKKKYEKKFRIWLK
jgi:hypothetical protein